jgi:hypothetical protein
VAAAYAVRGRILPPAASSGNVQKHYRFAFLGGRVPGYVVERRRRAELAMAELRRVEVASIPLLGEGIDGAR